MISELMCSLLVVDDEPELRSVLQEYLAFHGYPVRSAADVVQARELVTEAVPDVAILDVNMPGEDGLSFARYLRQAHPRVRIVLLTTAIDLIDRGAALTPLIDDFVPKPFQVSHLLGAVKGQCRAIAALDAA